VKEEGILVVLLMTNNHNYIKAGVPEKSIYFWIFWREGRKGVQESLLLRGATLGLDFDGICQKITIKIVWWLKTHQS
jgi:hypothetical protein